MSIKSDLAQAIGYTLTHWKALTRYCNDGRIEIDSNAAERAAAIYSLVEAAKLNGLDPAAYLHKVFERIADHPINQIDELLPWKVARQWRDQPQERRVARRRTTV